MAKLMNSPAKRNLVLILALLTATNLAIVLNVPVLRQVLGFAFFTFAPGVLILHALRLDRLSFMEKVVLSVGCSVSFLMLFGLALNFLYPYLGNNTPLSTNSLLISFSAIIVTLCLIGYKRSPRAFSILPLPALKLGILDKAFLVLPFLFPLWSILGVRSMNATGNNMPLTALLILISVYVTLAVIMRRKISEQVYPLMILPIGISLLLMFSLRSSYIIGMDAHHEFYLFQLTVANQRWGIFESNILNAVLSTSLLPAVYQAIMGMDAEWLFKVILSSILSISPLVVYIIARRYMDGVYAFLAAFFFISIPPFMSTAEVARSNIAALFFGLAFMVIFHDKINEFARRLLTIIFAISVIFSHYSSAYVLLALLFMTLAGTQAVPRISHHGEKLVAPSQNPTDDAAALTTAPAELRQPRQVVSLSLAILFLVIVFFWYSQVTAVPFSAGVKFIKAAFTQLSEFAVIEARGSAVDSAFRVSERAHYATIPTELEFAVSWGTVALLSIGVLTSFGNLVTSTFAKMRRWLSPSVKVDVAFLVLSFACFTVLVLSVALPRASAVYGLERTYFQMAIILSPFLVLGGQTLARYVKLKAQWLLLIVLLPYFLSTSGAIYSVYGVPKGMTLFSEGLYYEVRNITDRDSFAAKWLKDYRDENITINTDHSTIGKLPSLAMIRRNVDNRSLIHPKAPVEGYVYLTTHNVVDGKLFDAQYKELSLVEFQGKFEGKSKIYSNGGAEIWR